MLLLLAAGLVLILGGCAAAPKPAAVAPVAMQVPAVKPEPCYLPPVPQAPHVVGYPTAKTIYLTMDDLQAVIQTLNETNIWLRAVQHCVEQQLQR
jgi:hypothetical protein